jgi:hypothetical protein
MWQWSGQSPIRRSPRGRTESGACSPSAGLGLRTTDLFRQAWHRCRQTHHELCSRSAYTHTSRPMRFEGSGGGSIGPARVGVSVAADYFGSTFRLPPGEPGGDITGIPAPPAGGCNTPPCCRPLGAIRSGGSCGEPGDERRGGGSFGGAGCGFCAPAAQGNAAAKQNRKKASLCVTIDSTWANP